MSTRRSTTKGQYSFSQVPSTTIPRSAFNRSFGHKTTFDGGYLVPFFVDEALPGDTFNMRATLFARLATPIHPIMDNLSISVFFFAVPLRLVWNNFQKFMGEQENPGDSTDYLVPENASTPPGGWMVGSVADYMGIPTDVDGLKHSVLPFRAYNLIWNEWFRDENLQNSLTVQKDDGPDDHANYPLQRRGKRHDYFTSCLPFPQKGPSVVLGLGDQAPLAWTQPLSAVQSTGIAPTFNAGSGGGSFLKYTSGSSNVDWSVNAASTGNATWDNAQLLTDLSTASGYADLSAATASTVNQLREGFQIQRLLERDARGGTRYTEVVRSHFSVVSPDARLQRPEYLGGGMIPVSVNPVPQTSESTTTPQANLAAFGVASRSGIGFTKSFSEHCIVLGLVSAKADLNYQQGLERMWSRRSRYDFYWPAFAHLGEQAVLNKEIYAQGTAQDEETFGYQERWAEYRYKPSMITGQFRSTYAQSLDTWHLAQEFTALPVLGEQFIEDNPPIDRVIAVTSEPHFLLDSFMQYRCARPMPMYSVPGLIDHF